MTLAGPVASGRTVLLGEFSDYAATSGATVLSASGSLMERDHPLAVFRQFFQVPGVDAEAAGRVGWMLDNWTFARGPSVLDPGPAGSIPPGMLQGLCAVILTLAGRAPVVLCVDDAHHADPQTLDLLLYLVRRIRSAPVLVVLTERESAVPVNPEFGAELACQPHHEHVRLEPLSPESVSEAVAARHGEGAARRLTRDMHDLSGGNPLLVGALLDDYEEAARRDPAAPPERPVAGAAFHRALRSRAYRLGRPAGGAEGDAASEREPGRLLAGLLGEGTQAAARAVQALGALTAGSRAASGPGREAGAAEPLRRLRAIRPGEVAVPANTVLCTSRGTSAAPPLRGLVRKDDTDLLLPEAGKVPHVAVPGPLRSGTAARYVKYLSWHGREEEALGSLRRLEEAGHTPGTDRNGAVQAARDWVAFWYPDLRAEVASHARTDAAHGRVTTSRRAVDAASGWKVLSALMADGDGEQAVARAEAVLESCPMGTGALETLITALSTLIYADRADRAARWCEPLLEQTTIHCSPSWQGMFAAVRAETAIRLGKPHMAEECVRAAITHIRLESWGVAIGVPFATMVTAKVAMGKYEDAARYLAVPVPDAMFRTPAGLHYLHARGAYHLACGRHETALADFERCGALMAAWGIDHPGLVPWRVGAGRANLAMGRTTAARALADEQLLRLPPGSFRTRGLALRLRAAVVSAPERPALLEKAAEILRVAGDRFELAHTLADLSAAHHDLGDTALGRAVEHRALRIARACRAEPLRESLSRTLLSAGQAGGGPGLGNGAMVGARGIRAGAGTPDLSDAERRVAALAAQGFTNRQISTKLYITVSTVEQHLTRIYRKLGVSRRIDLANLEADLAG
ncbi:hypothetical protein Ssi02_62080 [Sinosporangium siamense]|uniref:HTH luxR-type domain-containing protein n=1 Tax=Sinosporangium siamense TaxID=1367973 RepID=A0A919RLG2_9ACTN|nr:hypothetical protein Ssi02_62080 [Sinosporangium siamense]